MASSKAGVAKDKGNAAFKSGDYPTAIEHYTDAILADDNDHTFYLNRAAAYLKLEKSEDAARDCTSALALSPNNVKAFFRRGQAQRALGNLVDARADFDRALALDPANESVKNEIRELSLNATTPKRRRVPIEIVQDSQANDAELLQPVSSRPLKRNSTPTTAQAPQTFADAKQAREESKPIRVSGGIIRHTGNHTILTRTSSEARPKPNTPLSPKPPTTLFQFTKSWESLRSDTDKWNLIRTIPPSSIPALFQVSLEPELLRSILHTFQAMLEQHSSSEMRDNIRDYLAAFAKVQRFGTVMLFMDKQERQLLELLHEKVDTTYSQDE